MLLGLLLQVNPMFFIQVFICIDLDKNQSNKTTCFLFVPYLTLFIFGKSFYLLPEANSRRFSTKCIFLKISQYSQKNTCVGVSF